MAAGPRHAGRALPTVREAHLAEVTVCYRCFLETEKKKNTSQIDLVK